MRTYGLIGKSLGHSFSPDFFNEKFLRENLPQCKYELFPLQSIEALIPLIWNNPEIAGLNVTIPYKKEVIPLLDEVDALALEIGAVNTIKIIRNVGTIKLVGFNTDASGFIHSCPALQKLPHALVLGTGGSAQAICYVLKQWNIPFLSVSRKPKLKNEIAYADLSQSIMERHSLIINTTPLGMFPKTEEFPPLPYHFITPQHFLYDLIYNPEQTFFLQKGSLAGAFIQNGELMLELQAEHSWEIWNS